MFTQNHTHSAQDISQDAESAAIVFNVLKQRLFELCAAYREDCLHWTWKNGNDFVVRFVELELDNPLNKSANELLCKSTGQHADIYSKFVYKTHVLKIFAWALKEHARKTEDSKLSTRLDAYFEKYKEQLADLDELVKYYREGIDLLILYFKVDCRTYFQSYAQSGLFGEKTSLYATQRLGMFSMAYDLYRTAQERNTARYLKSSN